MKKQSFLPNFPTTLFGRSKTSSQVRVLNEMRAALERGSSELSLLFDELLPASDLVSISKSKRVRSFDDITVLWAWIGQVLSGNESCSHALARIQAWCAETGRDVPGRSTSSYCRARQRVDEGFLSEVFERLNSRLLRMTEPSSGITADLKLKAIDGSSVRLDDTPENQNEYPQPSSQKPGCGFPVMGVSAVMDLDTQSWSAVRFHPNRCHDMRAAFELLDEFEDGDLVIADRAYSGYELVASLAMGGAHSLIRLHQMRERALDWRKGKRISKYERLVIWSKPQWREKSPITREQWEALPEAMEIRLIKLKVEKRGGKLKPMILATTLVDHKAYEAFEVFDLYLRRWHIELRLREAKTTMQMEHLRVKSPEMARKTMLVALIAHNLIRGLMLRAAGSVGVDPGALAFKAALESVEAHRSRYRGRLEHHHVRARIFDELIDQIATRILYQRPGRSEPRATKNRPKSFQYLTKPRSEFVEIQHRSGYRKAA